MAKLIVLLHTINVNTNQNILVEQLEDRPFSIHSSDVSFPFSRSHTSFVAYEVPLFFLSAHCSLRG
jgi:hypothetical protein